MNKTIKKRKSQMCVKWCKSKNCYDTYEKRILNAGSRQSIHMVWINHCISREAVHNKVLKEKS